MVLTRRTQRLWLLNSSRVHLRRLNQAFAESVRPGARVLDAGAGSAPYRALFQHAEYETADFEQLDKAYAPSTYVCDLASIPVEDQRFDHVVFNQVMEHLPDPVAVLEELHRVMKPGGTIICTCPLFYHEHEAPYDFHRFTQYAHRLHFEQAGFRIDRLEWVEGYFGTVGYQLEMMFRSLPGSPKALGGSLGAWLSMLLMWPTKLGAFIAAGLFYRMDIARPFKQAGMPKNYCVVATRTPGTAKE